jgi:hypothetical protein
MKRNFGALAIGLCLAVATAFVLKSKIDFVQSSLTSIGRVTQLTHGGHHPRISFASRTGEVFEFPTGSWLSREVGDSVAVRYSRNDPESSATIDSFLELYWLPLWLGAMAALCILGGVRGTPFKQGRY